MSNLEHYLVRARPSPENFKLVVSHRAFSFGLRVFTSFADDKLKLESGDLPLLHFRKIDLSFERLQCREIDYGRGNTSAELPPFLKDPFDSTGLQKQDCFQRKFDALDMVNVLKINGEPLSLRGISGRVENSVEQGFRRGLRLATKQAQESFLQKHFFKNTFTQMSRGDHCLALKVFEAEYRSYFGRDPWPDCKHDRRMLHSYQKYISQKMSRTGQLRWFPRYVVLCLWDCLFSHLEPRSEGSPSWESIAEYCHCMVPCFCGLADSIRKDQKRLATPLEQPDPAFDLRRLVEIEAL